MENVEINDQQIQKIQNELTMFAGGIYFFCKSTIRN